MHAIPSVINSTHIVSSTVQCVQDFDAVEEIDLGMRVGDIVTVVSQVDENWLYGHLADGRDGIFPAAFVMEVDPNAFAEYVQPNLFLLQRTC